LLERVVWSVGQSATVVRPAKTAQTIKMPFGLRTRVGPMNHTLDGGVNPQWKGVILKEKGRY